MGRHLFSHDDDDDDDDDEEEEDRSGCEQRKKISFF
jgi:hypothetical protein